MSNKFLYGLIAVAILLGIIAYVIQPNISDVPTADDTNTVACTMDAKQCPDGSYVARVAPSCDFAACPEPAEQNNEINVVNPQPGQVVPGQLFIVGEAIGPWYFEATLPVEVLDWQGAVVAQGYVTALTDWMTESMVPFSGQITFTSPYNPGDPQNQNAGSLVFKKANPSGEPQFDDQYVVPITFAP